MDTVESRNTYKLGAVAFTPNRTKLNAESYQFLKAKYASRKDNNDENATPIKYSSKGQQVIDAARMVKTPKAGSYPANLDYGMSADDRLFTSHDVNASPVASPILKKKAPSRDPPPTAPRTSANATRSVKSSSKSGIYTVSSSMSKWAVPASALPRSPAASPVFQTTKIIKSPGKTGAFKGKMTAVRFKSPDQTSGASQRSINTTSSGLLGKAVMTPTKTTGSADLSKAYTPEPAVGAGFIRKFAGATPSRRTLRLQEDSCIQDLSGNDSSACGSGNDTSCLSDGVSRAETGAPADESVKLGRGNEYLTVDDSVISTNPIARSISKQAPKPRAKSTPGPASSSGRLTSRTPVSQSRMLERSIPFVAPSTTKAVVSVSSVAATAAVQSSMVERSIPFVAPSTTKAVVSSSSVAATAAVQSSMVERSIPFVAPSTTKSPSKSPTGAKCFGAAIPLGSRVARQNVPVYEASTENKFRGSTTESSIFRGLPHMRPGAPKPPAPPSQLVIRRKDTGDHSAEIFDLIAAHNDTVRISEMSSPADPRQEPVQYANTVGVQFPSPVPKEAGNYSAESTPNCSSLVHSPDRTAPDTPGAVFDFCQPSSPLNYLTGNNFGYPEDGEFHDSRLKDDDIDFSCDNGRHAESSAVSQSAAYSDDEEDKLVLEDDLVRLLHKYKSPLKSSAGMENTSAACHAALNESSVGGESDGANALNNQSSITMATTLTLDDDFAGATTHSDVRSGSPEATHRLLITPRECSSKGLGSMKELLLVSHGVGEASTVKLTFGNKHKSPLVVNSRAVQMRFDSYHSNSNMSVLADENAPTGSGHTGAFQASPHHMSITKGKEATLYVTFVPNSVGVYGGALTVKSNRKTYVVLLRGECKSKATKTVATTSTPRRLRTGANHVNSPGIDDLLGNRAKSAPHEVSVDEDTVKTTTSQLQLRQEEQAVGSSVKHKKIWLQQWLTQNHASSEYGSTVSSSDLQEDTSRHNNSNSSGELLENSSICGVSETVQSQSNISIIPQTVLLFSYDQDIGKYMRRNPSSSSTLFAQRVYKSKFVIRNFGHSSSSVSLTTSTPTIKITDASIAINAHCDACVKVQYTTSIHDVRRQLEPVLPTKGKQSSRSATGSNSNALALNRSAHIGYILLCTNEGTEFVIEVKFHPQYVDQLLSYTPL